MIQCYLCGSRNVWPLFSEKRQGRTYTNYHCTECDLFQTLGDIDPISPDYIDLKVGDLDDAHRFLQTTHKLPAFRQWQALIEHNMIISRAETTILDVGCGIGGFLDFAKSMNLVTYGFDASKAHVAVARIQHQMVLHSISVSKYIEQLVSPPHFDLVTFWDVFEHVREPNQLLSELHGVLKPNNGLLFLSVPSGAMSTIRVRIASLLNRPTGLIPWEHVFYYTPTSLKRMLEISGFEIVAQGGVQPYLRYPWTVHEIIRRVTHHILRNTPYALQIYALARPV